MDVEHDDKPAVHEPAEDELAKDEPSDAAPKARRAAMPSQYHPQPHPQHQHQPLELASTDTLIKHTHTLMSIPIP